MNSDPNLARELAEMRRRLDRLERSPRLTNASASDDAGVKRIEFGKIAHPLSDPVGAEDFGIIGRNSAGAEVFLVDSGGSRVPGDKGFIQAAAGGSTNATPQDTHTSTSFVESWSSWFVGVLGSVVTVQLLIAAGTGITAAEARLRTTGLNSGDATSDVIPLTANNSLVQYTWSWNPGGTVAAGDVWGLLIDTRIVTGAGTMTIVKPRFCIQRSEVGITTNVTGT